MKYTSLRLARGVLPTLALLSAANAFAGAIITSGPVALGINDEGHLNYDVGNIVSNSTRTGLAILGNSGSYLDATSPGCFCEGWGVSFESTSGYANVSTDSGVNNLSVLSFTSTASTATSTVAITSFPDLVVSQAYQPASIRPNELFENIVTITNKSARDLNNVRYVRVMDWDVPPTEFNEYVTIRGTATTSLLEESHLNGFATANPLAIGTESGFGGLNVDVIDAGPRDHGARFLFNFGTIKAGESYSFSVYYGAAYDQATMLQALFDESIELYSLGQSNGGQVTGSPYTYAFGFKGVGGIVIDPIIPEPSTVAFIAMGLLGGLVAVRRRFAKRA